MSKYLGLPFDASANGVEIDNMMGLVHWLMLVLLVGWGAFFIYCLIRFRKSRNPKANYVGVKSHLSSYSEVGIAIVEGILLIGLAFPIWAEIRTEFPPEENSTVIHVVAEQFAWNVHYPGDDGVFGRRDISLITPENPLGLDRSDPDAKADITTINQLNLPVNKPVIVHLTSKDVIHSFGIPVMRVKQDVIPGMT
ncbi:MAG: cytochrome c oxidase subunit II, partial [Bacteroidota bacterium]